jgi:hypothetical protein
MSNIIDFQSASERRVSSVRSDPVLHPVDFPETAGQRRGQKRNPVRRLHSKAAIAVTIAGKLHRGEPLRANAHLDEREWLRRGAEAARLLADELARLVENEARTARFVEKYNLLSPEDRRIVDRVIEEHDL